MAKKTTRKPVRKKRATRSTVTRSAAAKKTARKAGATAAAKSARKKTAKKAATRPSAKKPARKKKTTKKAATKASAGTARERTKAAANQPPAATRNAASTKRGKTAAAARASNGAAAKRKTPAASADGAAKKKKRRPGTARKRPLGARSVAEAASVGEADAQGYVYVNGRRVRMISTAAQGVNRKTSNTTADKALEGPKAKAAKPTKTHLTAKELRHYRTLLLKKRQELVGDVRTIESAALQERGGNLSNLPIHMADIGTDTYDQDFMLSLAETERKRLHEIEAALRRIADKTYGICQKTGEPIPAVRLEAKPWAQYTIEAARELERQWGPR